VAAIAKTAILGLCRDSAVEKNAMMYRFPGATEWTLVHLYEKDGFGSCKLFKNPAMNVFEFKFRGLMYMDTSPVDAAAPLVGATVDGEYHYIIEQDTTVHTEVTAKGIIKWAKERVKRYPMVTDDVWCLQERRYVNVSVHNTVKRELIKVLIQYENISWCDHRDYELREELTNITLFGAVGYKKMTQRQLLKMILDVADSCDAQSVEELMGRVDESGEDNDSDDDDE
jgi:hypothetical protein